MDPSHPFGVSLSQVVVNGNNVNALPRDCIEIRRQCGYQCLSFTCSHFRNIAKVQCRPTHYLHVVVALSQRSIRGLSHGRESFWHEVIETFTVRVALFELDC